MQPNTMKTERQKDQDHLNVRWIKKKTWREVDFGSLHLPTIFFLSCQSSFVKNIVSFSSDLI